MEAHRLSTATPPPSIRRPQADPHAEPLGQQRSPTKLDRRPQAAAETQPSPPPGSLLMVGAKTLTGIGIGLLFVFGGAALIGIAAEAVIVPSLLVKMAGGVAGGGMGLSKGVKDMNKMR